MKEANQLVFQFTENVNPFLRKHKRWDKRADGKVFWQYSNRNKSGEIWMTIESATKANESIKKASRKQRLKNPEKHAAANKKWRETNKDKHSQSSKNYYQKNKAHANNVKRKRRLERRHSEPLFSLAQAVRSSITKAFKNKNYKKSSKTKTILGCDWNELANHVEAQFAEGMSWENRGQWHIDHIIPLASAKTSEDVFRLNHYTNLRPLWALDNLRKGAKMLEDA